jgi:cell division protein FtsQ
MTAMDTRVAERRKGVSEDKARRRLRWILVVLGVTLAAAASFWLIRSPVLSIRTVEVTGAIRSNPSAAVDGLGMGVGRPTIDVDAGTIEAAVEADPWVADAAVSVLWPGTVVVDVVEHEPLVRVSSGGGWVMMSSDGAVLEAASAPGPDDAAIVIDAGPIAIGESTHDRDLLGALVFIDALAADLREGTVVDLDVDVIRARVQGHPVRLGRPIDMATKATVLEGLIGAGIEDGASVNLIAPSRPAVNPRPQDEVQE